MAIVTAFTDGMSAQRVLDNQICVITNRIDFSEHNAAASDTVQVLKVLNGDVVLDWLCTVATAEGTASTCSVGDASDDDGYDTTMDTNAAGNYRMVVGDGYSAGRVYAADDTIDLYLSAVALDTCVLYVQAHVMNRLNLLA